MDGVIAVIAQSRCDVEQARMLVREAARLMDVNGNADSRTRQFLSLTKALVPRVAQEVADRAMQVHGAMGVSQDTFLTNMWSSCRTLRLADGPDEVHWRTAGRLELTVQRATDSPLRRLGDYAAYNRAQAASSPFRRSTDPVSTEVLAKL